MPIFLEDAPATQSAFDAVAETVILENCLGTNGPPSACETWTAMFRNGNACYVL